MDPVTFLDDGELLTVEEECPCECGSICSDEKSLNKHKQSRKHIQNMILTGKCVDKNLQGFVWCKECGMFVSTHNHEKHLTTHSHKKRAGLVERVKCEVCDTFIQKYCYQTSHMTSKKHIFNLAKQEGRIISHHELKPIRNENICDPMKEIIELDEKKEILSDNESDEEIIEIIINPGITHLKLICKPI